jgi:hypothetical protein
MQVILPVAAHIEAGCGEELVICEECLLEDTDRYPAPSLLACSRFPPEYSVDGTGLNSRGEPPTAIKPMSGRHLRDRQRQPSSPSEYVALLIEAASFFNVMLLTPRPVRCWLPAGHKCQRRQVR